MPKLYKSRQNFSKGVLDQLLEEKNGTCELHGCTIFVKCDVIMASSDLLEEDVSEEGKDARGQQPDHTLVYGDDGFQGVDTLLHGVGVDVVIDGGSNAPHYPHSIHHCFYGGRDHLERCMQPGPGCLLAPLL